MSMIITYVDVGRPLTPEELAARRTYMAAELFANHTNGQNAGIPNVSAGVHAWDTVESAEAYIAWTNVNYNPPPVETIVTTVG